MKNENSITEHDMRPHLKKYEENEGTSVILTQSKSKFYKKEERERKNINKFVVVSKIISFQRIYCFARNPEKLFSVADGWRSCALCLIIILVKYSQRF